MIAAVEKRNEVGASGGKMLVERATLEALRRKFDQVKRMAEQTRKDADNGIGEIDKLLRQATDSKA